MRLRKNITYISNKLGIKSRVFFKFAEGNIGSYKRELPIVQKFFDAMWKDRLLKQKLKR